MHELEILLFHHIFLLHLNLKKTYVAFSNHIEIHNIQKSHWIMYTIYSIIVLRRQIRYLSNDLRVNASRIEVGLGMA